MRKTIMRLLFTTILLIFVGVLLFLNFRLDWGNNDSVLSALNIVTVATAILGVLGIILQLERERSLKEAEFIINFNDKFIEFEVLSKVHDVCTEQLGKTVDGNNSGKQLDISSVYVYLDCLEPLYILIKNKAVSIDKIYDLISYRFFVVLNNREVQERVILPHRTSYTNIIEMYRMLDNFRKKEKRPDPYCGFENTDLIKFLNDSVPTE